MGVGMTDGPHRWRKSSRSNVAGNCVELAATLDRVRDSKNPAGPALRVDLAAFLTGVKSGRFTC
jgi:Domain of unknown function (DUF397)